MNPEPEKTEHINWLLDILLVCLFFVPYSIVGHLNIVRHTLPFLPGEELIPFLPWTFGIYLSAFFQGILIIYLIPKKSLGRALRLASLMLLIGLTCFVLFPIEFPRILYPTANDFITYFRAFDSAGNCLPSFHVAMAFFLTSYYSFFETSKTKRVVMWTWSTLIILSVLTTKQHYITDVVGGIILALPFVYFEYRQRLVI